MSEAAYSIGDQLVRSSEQGFEEALAQAYKKKVRPLCLCQMDRGIEMYLAKVGDRVIIKRMPETGPLHAPDCDSYEPPPELSGLGEVLGSAIQENEEGITELKFDFSMSQQPGRAVPKKEAKEEDSVRTDGKKLTIRSTLQFLWERANLHRWSAAMAGKRSWSVVRKYILQAAGNSSVKGSSLADRLYIPEVFKLDQKDAIAHRRKNHLSKITASQGTTRQLGILVGELKEIKPARYGQKLIIKHCSDFSFILADDIHERLLKRYADELELWEAFQDTENPASRMCLVVIATFGAGPVDIAAGRANILEIALMPVSANWIPFEHVFEKELIEDLTAAGRRFIKGLRYNLAKDKPLASVVLSDTSPLPTAMYIQPVEATEEFIAELSELQEGSHLAPWVWDTSEFDKPEFPRAK